MKKMLGLILITISGLDSLSIDPIQNLSPTSLSNSKFNFCWRHIERRKLYSNKRVCPKSTTLASDDKCYYPCSTGLQESASVCLGNCPEGTSTFGKFCFSRSSLVKRPQVPREAIATSTCINNFSPFGNYCAENCPPGFSVSGPFCISKCPKELPVNCRVGCSQNSGVCVAEISRLGLMLAVKWVNLYGMFSFFSNIDIESANKSSFTQYLYNYSKNNYKKFPFWSTFLSQLLDSYDSQGRMFLAKVNKNAKNGKVFVLEDFAGLDVTGVIAAITTVKSMLCPRQSEDVGLRENFQIETIEDGAI